MRETVSVALPGREYDVIIGPGLLADAGALIAPLLRSEQSCHLRRWVRHPARRHRGARP